MTLKIPVGVGCPGMPVDTIDSIIGVSLSNTVTCWLAIDTTRVSGPSGIGSGLAASFAGFCFELGSDGTAWRPIVHIEDISRAFIAALEAPLDHVFNEAFNVGQTAHNYRIRELAEIVAGVVPGCTIEFADDAGPDKRSYRVSFEKIRRKLPMFQPQWDARMGAEQLYNAYRLSGLTLEEFEGPRYQRIGHIKKLLADGVLDAELRYPEPQRHAEAESIAELAVSAGC